MNGIRLPVVLAHGDDGTTQTAITAEQLTALRGSVDGVRRALEEFESAYVPVLSPAEAGSDCCAATPPHAGAFRATAHIAEARQRRRPIVSSLPAMIIEAGYDLLQLFSPDLFPKRKMPGRRALWVIAMDEDLRLLYSKKVKGDANLPIEERACEIADALADESPWRVAYFAVACLDTDLCGNYSSEFERQVEMLRSAPELIEHELIGHYLSDGKGLYSSAPRYSFRDYLGLEHLPRVAILPGPHEYPCDCLACVQFEDKLRLNRERHAALESEEKDGS